jgi:hypothetical protein
MFFCVVQLRTALVVTPIAPTSGYEQNIIIAAIDRWMAAKTRQ